MATKTWFRVFPFIVLASLLICLAKPGTPQTAAAASDSTLAKIEPQVLDEIAAKGQTDFFFIMREQADISPAAKLSTKIQKGEFVYNTLRVTADQTQKQLRSYLDEQGAQYTPYYIVNLILVRGGTQDLLMEVAARTDVESITANHIYKFKNLLPRELGPEAPATVESNLTFVNADDVWALGVTGQDIVLAGNDSGLEWDHPAIKEHYRGWDGTNVDHDYNWWAAMPDIWGTYPSDGDGEGTYTTGIMVGDDGAGNQIGIAPGAKTIHCKNILWDGQYAISQDSWYLECFEWDLAPWDLQHQNPLPEKAPDAVNVSWNGYIGSANNNFRTAIDNLIAAGILVEASAGDGYGCSALISPGDYQEVLTTGSVDHSGGVLPGTLSSDSGSGPSLLDGNYFPDIVAPGESIRSSSNHGGYSNWGGTSIAGPHATGLVALLWSANMALRGKVEPTIQIIQDTAVPLTGQLGHNCDGDYTEGPNNDWGYGTIDALAAVQAAYAYGGLGKLDGTVTELGYITPIPGAQIEATLSITQSFNSTTNASGYYNMWALTGTYTVEAAAYGYLPGLATGIVVSEDLTTTVDFALDIAPSHVLSVTVVDANTGWPLYALTSLGGSDLDPVWNDPVTGHFEVVLPDGWIYTLGVDAWTPGYLHQNVQVGPFYSDTEVVIELEPDLEACTAPGYEIVPLPLMAEDFETSDGGFTLSGYNISWEWGVPVYGPGTAHSGTNVWATGLDEPYNYNEDSFLTSPEIDLSGYADEDIYVNWWQWLQTQNLYDDAVVQISDDGGGHWYTFYGPMNGDVDLNWTEHSTFLDPSYAVDNFMMRFHLWSDGSENYPGWYLDDVGIEAHICTPIEGGLVVGNVYDANDGLPFIGATVENDSGFSTLTVATEDPDVDDSFYVLYSPSGLHEFTASFDSYSPDEEMVDVITGSTVGQDFYLTAGHLVFDPLSMHVNLLLGNSLTQTLTITDDGNAAAMFTIAEVNKGFDPLLEAAGKTVIIPATPPELPAGTAVAAGPGYQPRSEMVIHIPAAPAAGLDVLIACADEYNCEPLASQLMSFGDIGSVTSYDARYGTPTLDILLAYDVVLTWSNYSYADAYGLGNVLADYVDAGGKVINLMFGLNPLDMQGRFATEDYTAMKGSDIDFATECLGWFDVSHPIMAGITNVCDFYRLYGTYLTPDSTAVANWTDGEIFVAAKDNQTVVSLGMYVGYYTNMTGQGYEVVHNAIMWLAGGVDVPWLSEEPITGTVPVNSSQIVNVTFDAGIPEITQPGDFFAQLRITSDTPYLATTIPMTMTVTPPDSYGKLKGTVQGLGYCDANPAALEDATVFIESNLGYTWTLETDENGHYKLWLDEANTPISITVSAEEYLGQVRAGVIISGQEATTENFDLRWLEPCVSSTPESFEVELDLGEITTTLMTLSNSGAEAAFFEFHEMDMGYNPAAKAVHIPASDGNFEHRPASLGPAPTSDHPVITGVPASEVIATLVGEPAFAVDRSSGNLVYIPNTTNPGTWVVIGSTSGNLWGGDFLNGDFSKMYVLDDFTKSLYTLDTSTAALTLIGPAVPENDEVWTGLTGSTYGVLYGSASTSSGSTLYRIDPATGEATAIGPITNGPEIIDIAINASGEMYGVDITTDALVRINPSTGAGTVVGSLGVDANYAQGMDFEEKSGILYWASWNYNLWGGELRVIDTTTGNSTSIGAFQYTDEVDCLAFATGGASDVPWVSEDPASGTLPADVGEQNVTISFDASAVPQPGTYNASLKVLTDDPFNGLISIPLTMTVNATPDYGKLMGTVTGLGYCDDDPAPVAGAEVTIEASDGTSVTSTTDANGGYSYWLSEAGNNYTVSVTAEDHEPGVPRSVEIQGLITTTVDFELRWLAPCVSVTPPALEVDVPLGYEQTVALNILNGGAFSSTFEISEREGTELPLGISTLTVKEQAPEGTSSTVAPAGYVPTLSKTSSTPTFPTGGLVAVFKDVNPWGTVDVENFLAANGIPYEVHTSSEFSSLDFGNFGMIVFSGDQLQGFYDIYALYVDKFEDYVEDGGFLNFFARDYGWNGGGLSAPLPGGMTLYDNFGSPDNYVVDPAHPVMAGIPYSFYGSNNGYFTDLPEDAHVIATEQYYGYPTIVEYPLGAGWVIAFSQALEYLHYYYGYEPGLILENTLLWGYTFEPDVDVSWLAENPITGIVSHDGSSAVDVTFTAFPTMTVGGVYTASLIVKNDDLANSRIKVPVTMNVVAPVYSLEVSPDQAGSGEPGDVVTYTVTVTNTSAYATDSYTVTLGASAYDTGLGVGEDPVIVIGPVAPGENTTFLVTVHIPTSALDGDHDTVVITVTSVSDPVQTAVTNVTTNVYVLVQPPKLIYLPLTWKAP